MSARMNVLEFAIMPGKCGKFSTLTPRLTQCDTPAQYASGKPLECPSGATERKIR